MKINLETYGAKELSEGYRYRVSLFEQTLEGPAIAVSILKAKRRNILDKIPLIRRIPFRRSESVVAGVLTFSRAGENFVPALVNEANRLYDYYFGEVLPYENTTDW